MVKWSGEKDVTWLLILVLGWPVIILLVMLLVPLVISHPIRFIIAAVLLFISGLFWLVLRK